MSLVLARKPAVRWRAARRLALVAGAVLAVGCGGEADAAALRQRAEPLLADFERFDRWARRTLAADLALRDPVALEEALFAPIRRDDAIVAAWVERVGPDARAAGFRLESPPEVDLVRLRSVPMLSGLDAGVAAIPDPRGRRRDGPEPIDVVVLKRTAPSGRGSGSVQVTVVFLVGAPG